MIVRVVKMTFIEDKVPTFLSVFNASKEFIRAFEGCSHLELLKDINQNNVYFTYSYWDSERHLDNYRYSELFKGVWAQTKPLFAAKTEAWSLNQEIILT